jgi:ADP-heptose:LPS heptosyltransferase
MQRTSSSSSRASTAPVRRVGIFSQFAGTGLGDLVFRNALYATVRRCFPDATVTLVLTSTDVEDFREFLDRHALVDDVLACPPVDAGPPPGPAGEWELFLAQLRARRLDVCVIDPGSFWLNAEVAREAGVPVRVGTRTGAAEDHALTASAPVAGRGGHEPDLLDYVTACAAALGAPPPSRETLMPPLPFEPEGPQLDLPRPRIAMHVGGLAVWNRRWPLDNYVALADRLLGGPVGSIVLIGTDEQEENTYLLDNVQQSVRSLIHDLGDVSIARTATVLSECELLAGSDSGPMHLAVALGRPTVSIYGPADGEQFWDRVYLDHHPIGHHFPCQQMSHPWQTQDRAVCEHRCLYPVRLATKEYPRCLTDITVDEVFETVVGALDGRRGGAR